MLQQPEKGGAPYEKVSFFPIPWYVFVAYGCYVAVYISCMVFAAHVYGALPEHPKGYEDRVDVIHGYVFFATLVFVLATISFPLARKQMIRFYDRYHRGEEVYRQPLIGYSYKLAYYENTEVFKWYYNVMPALGFYSFSMFMVIITESQYPRLYAAMHGTPQARMPFVAMAITFAFAAIPSVLVMRKLSAAGVRYTTGGADTIAPRGTFSGYDGAVGPSSSSVGGKYDPSAPPAYS